MSKEEQMYRFVSEYHGSGQSGKSFCKEKQIKHSTFQYWIQKERRSRASAFVSVKSKVVYDSHSIELIYPNGVKLRNVQSWFGTSLSAVPSAMRYEKEF